VKRLCEIYLCGCCGVEKGVGGGAGNPAPCVGAGYCRFPAGDAASAARLIPLSLTGFASSRVVSSLLLDSG
jgi:hypothetical protein